MKYDIDDVLAGYSLLDVYTNEDNIVRKVCETVYEVRNGLYAHDYAWVVYRLRMRQLFPEISEIGERLLGLGNLRVFPKLTADKSCIKIKGHSGEFATLYNDFIWRCERDNKRVVEVDPVTLGYISDLGFVLNGFSGHTPFIRVFDREHLVQAIVLLEFARGAWSKFQAFLPSGKNVHVSMSVIDDCCICASTDTYIKRKWVDYPQYTDIESDLLAGRLQQELLDLILEVDDGFKW